MWLLLVVSQASGPAVDPTQLNWTQLGVASIVCLLLLGFLVIVWQTMRKDAQVKETTIADRDREIARLQELRITERDEAARRSEDRAERVTVLLTKTADTMEALPRQVERMLGTARDSTTREQQEDLLRELRDQVADLKRLLANKSL